MKSKIITAVALSLSFGTAAVAQTSLETETGYSAGMPAGWEGDISKALFEDADSGVLHSEADVRDNFEGLSPDQQAMIRSHCALVDTAAHDAATDDFAQDLDSDRDEGVADLGLNEDIQTGATDLEDLEPAADLETAADADTGVDAEIETGATIGSTSDIDSDVEQGTEMGATSDLDSEFETGEAELGVDSEIETGATGTTNVDEFETETEFSQEMDGQLSASIEQACAWID